MVVVLPNNVRDAACDAIVDLCDVSPPGSIELKSSASTVAGTNEVATLPFPNPAFGASSAGVATAGTIVDDTNATGGTANDATFFDGAGLNVLQCDVAASGSDINLSSITIGATDTVQITSLTVTVPVS